MKRILVSTAVIFWAGTSLVSGQFPSSLGVKAGISVADQTYKFEPIDYKMETDVVLGPAFSLFMEVLRGDHFSLQVMFEH